jgi:predicted lipoprotein with Yx(FWY)xxD motif
VFDEQEVDPMIRTRVGVAVAVAATGLLALSACDSGFAGSAPRVDVPSAEQQPAAQPGQPAGQLVVAAVKLSVAEVGSLGAVVTDQAGRTLYRFDKDKAKPPKSNCIGDCAKSWPPVIIQDLSQVEFAAVDKTLVGAVTRTDGSTQLTLAGWPLYRYTGDLRAGDSKGQGVDGTWFAATPQGKKAAATAPAPDAGGY